MLIVVSESSSMSLFELRLTRDILCPRCSLTREKKHKEEREDNQASFFLMACLLLSLQSPTTKHPITPPLKLARSRFCCTTCRRTSRPKTKYVRSSKFNYYANCLSRYSTNKYNSQRSSCQIFSNWRISMTS